MTVAIASFVFLLAVFCAALMGYAIQRGATCTVAAVGEIVHEGKANRLIAMGEAAVWVAGGLLVARALGLTVDLPSGFATTGWTIVGAMLLGLGAWVNSACVFGAIARLGSGEWAYVMTPVGFFIGALSMSSLFPGAMPVSVSASHGLPDWLVIAFVLFASWRLLGLIRNIRSDPRKGGRVWDPHEATIVIGIALVIMFVGVGDWTYMNVLMRVAHGMADDIDWRLILFCALLGGAVLGGWTAGRLSSRMPTRLSIARCLAGGVLMGWGSALIPGSNDGLILIGLPFLQPYAWIGVAVMALTIWIAIQIELRVGSR